MLATRRASREVLLNGAIDSGASKELRPSYDCDWRAKAARSGEAVCGEVATDPRCNLAKRYATGERIEGLR